MKHVDVAGDTPDGQKIGSVNVKTLVTDTVSEAAQENGTVDPEKKAEEEEEEDESQYPSVKVVVVVMVALYLSMFLVALVCSTQTIDRMAN